MMDDDTTFQWHGDDLSSFRYDEEFDLDELGRAGRDVMSVSNDNGDMDAIEYNEDPGIENHRIEGKPGGDIRDFLKE